MPVLKRKKPERVNEDYLNSLRITNYDNHRSNPTLFSKEGFYFTYRHYLKDSQEFILTMEIRGYDTGMPDVSICAWVENQITGATKDYRTIFSGKMNKIPEALKPFIVKEEDVPEMPRQSTVEYQERQRARVARIDTTNEEVR